ncbi:hypothetical protein H257_01555 [Aphanomyces astaci]|uniref:Uncharacterized protein n=1 Tax=Aphanomyces astaci TaxID=112090 RepID=W4H8A2_APHAT|nr:hypothetical protein H257_01555 [Aphanomyces astaci]ETV88260.1 hypothetical protein H257_01555 [Aphanomyces astaci]|eukprot:XP_009823123.1 hypothetical protein H257_01555 [Aphanomyces astaci]
MPRHWNGLDQISHNTQMSVCRSASQCQIAAWCQRLLSQISNDQVVSVRSTAALVHPSDETLDDTQVAASGNQMQCTRRRGGFAATSPPSSTFASVLVEPLYNVQVSIGGYKDHRSISAISRRRQQCDKRRRLTSEPSHLLQNDNQ